LEHKAVVAALEHKAVVAALEHKAVVAALEHKAVVAALEHNFNCEQTISRGGKKRQESLKLLKFCG
jgi:hypothetical protein